MDRHIFGQGDLDGACFLYAVVNASVALTGRAPEFWVMAQALGQVDHPGDFLNGIVGTTGHYDQQYALLQDNIERILARLGDAAFTVERLEGPFPAARLAEVLGPDSVALVRYQGNSELTKDMDHWVCAVAHDAATGATFVACSVRFQKSYADGVCTYVERLHPESGRWSNDVLRLGGDIKIVEGEVFRVRVRG